MEQAADRNFRLCILNALLMNGRVRAETLERMMSSGDRDALAAAAREDQRAAVERVVAVLCAYPITDEDWASIETIEFDGGDEIYYLIEVFLRIDTGGETDFYQYASIDDARKCTNLRELQLAVYESWTSRPPLSLAPLAHLEKLESLTLDGGHYTDTQALHALPALGLMRVRSLLPFPSATLSHLRERGLDVPVWP